MTCIGFLFTVFFAAAAFSAPESTSTVDILKKISAASIRRAVKSSKTIEEVAGKVGVTPGELRTICSELNIALPARLEPKPPPPPVETAPPLKRYTGELPTDAVLAVQGKPSAVLVVDKSAYTLYLVRYENGRALIQEAFDCKTGKNSGDKQERGDHRTPEGVFFFNAKLTRSEIEAQVGKPNAYQYGEMAFVTDFPNQIDRLKGKNGGGIWLHGTDEPFDSTPSRDTRGCVVTTNETIRKLSSFIALDRTPLIVLDTIRPTKPDDIQSERNDALALMESWRKAWAEKRIDDYIRFTQDYAADNVANIGTKTLYFIRENDSWAIIAEQFRRSN